MSHIPHQTVKITASAERTVKKSPRCLPWEGTLAIVLLIVAWRWASQHSTPMFFPTLTQIFNTIVDLLSSQEGWSSVGINYARIVMYLAGSFIVSSLLGLLAAWNVHVERFCCRSWS